MHWQKNPSDASIVPLVQNRLNVFAKLVYSVTPQQIRRYKIDYPQIFDQAPEEKTLQIVSSENFVKSFGVGAYEGKLPLVLVHGDVHPSNLLFSSDSDRLTSRLRNGRFG